MHITGTHINYYLVCKRKLWLFPNQLQMEHSSQLVYEGRLIHESSYPQRSDKYTELEIDAIKIDYFDANKRVIHEIKKSNKKEDAHIWQLKYYIAVLERKGMHGVSGMLEYPKLRRREKVFLTDEDRAALLDMEKQIIELNADEHAPAKKKRSACRNCSYFDFCWVAE
jgi:CRISPR-associated exonuclease Cas4